MRESYQKQLKLALFIVGLLFVIFLVFAFCYYQFFHHKEIENEDCFVVKFKNSDILTIENKLPVSTTIGKELNGNGTADGIHGYIEFSIENKSNEKKKYVILLTKQFMEKEIASSYVKFYLTDEKDTPFKGFEQNIVPSYYDLLSFSDRPGSRVLYTGLIEGNDVLNFKLRMWLDDSYALSSQKEYFSVDLDVQ